ncbi:unnamed protein product [Brachionus calyciflorus]|uniref:G-protein coupled receptors family 1 profile domain-containing protein n=1 Tax=Brachionus calyciflorus TaxID=104777 RepID=A0A813ZSV4_9BILA|nr:unnamed protein product [Brachionus calyciflorus]
MNESSDENFLSEISTEKNFFLISESINFYACFPITIFGLIGNIITIYLLNSKPKTSKHTRRQSFFKLQINSTSLTTSDLYMLSLAISDSLFLLAHLIEDLIPSINKQKFYLQFINRSNVLCKIVLFVRNSARFSSSYLVVLFAYERFSCINSPLKRLKFHNRKFTHLTIFSVFFFSNFLMSYTILINGLREVENHEKIDHLTNMYECDVLIDYKFIYQYTIFIYTTLGIVLPMVIVSYLNIYIARVLLTRKNKILRSFTRCSSLNNQSSTNLERLSIRGEFKEASIVKINKLNSFEINKSESKKVNLWFKNKNMKKSNSLFGLNTSNSGKKILEQNSSDSRYVKKRALTAIYQFNGIKQKLKDSGRATIILVLLSVFFVALNFPYILSWCFFYIPYQSGMLKNENTVYLRYSFVLLAEILHLMNYSINLILCFMASKKFRDQFKNQFFYIKQCDHLYFPTIDPNQPFFFGFLTDGKPKPTPIIGNGSQNNPVCIYATTLKLLQLNCNTDNQEHSLFHIDGTYKITIENYPLLVFGRSNPNRTLYLIVFRITSKEEKENFVNFFDSIKFICRLFNINFSLKFLMQDAQTACASAANDCFPDKDVNNMHYTSNLESLYHIKEEALLRWSQYPQLAIYNQSLESIWANWPVFTRQSGYERGTVLESCIMIEKMVNDISNTQDKFDLTLIKNNKLNKEAESLTLAYIHSRYYKAYR